MEGDSGSLERRDGQGEGRRYIYICEGCLWIRGVFWAQPSRVFHVHEVTDGGVGWRCLLHDSVKYNVCKVGIW